MTSCNPAAVQNNRNFAALRHVRRSGNDLDFCRTDIDLADHKLIRIGVLLDFLYLTDDNLLKILIHIRISFYLRTG